MLEATSISIYTQRYSGVWYKVQECKSGISLRRTGYRQLKSYCSGVIVKDLRVGVNSYTILSSHTLLLASGFWRMLDRACTYLASIRGLG